jgi:hypothetical protein
MKFQKSINIWADGVQDQIRTGKLKVQRGQWMRCGTQGKPCRFVSCNGRTFSIVHWQGSSKRTQAAFMARVESERMGELMERDYPEWKKQMAAKREQHRQQFSS